MPKVYNVKDQNFPEDAVYCGRGSSYGNPFKIGQDDTRTEVIQKFEEYLYSNEDLLEKVKNDLRGKDLLCHCKPAKCHADILLEIANNDCLLDIEGSTR